MIRTLVVDDSKFMRTLISDMLVSDSHIDVIATAKDGMDAVAQARLHHPDVITLDVEMPRMDGLEALKAIIEDGQALIAPGDYHIVVRRAENGGRVVDPNQDPPVHAVRPAADIMLQSVAASYGSRTLGMILTGMGSDGACGMEAIREHGGKTIVSDEETSLIFGMPKAAIDLGCVDRIAPLHKIPEEIGSMLG
ncbi:MAG: hypothetical protein C4B59_04895 [Candidatus Methanogaster sp.]|uniref:Uncharacterized protein n=1 Tax=Candidatus Methanogaster sp. TaxID=3386292 RepID=A0AC61L3Z8_9EURY|nr:MAG: hypothetical protein C4B59_04895 [ANME-2 cluster archaeon]